MIEDKFPNISGLVTTAALNTKIGEIEDKIPNFGGLLTNTVVNKSW